MLYIGFSELINENLGVPWHFPLKVEPEFVREIARHRTEGGGEKKVNLLAGPEIFKVLKGFREMSKGYRCQVAGVPNREDFEFPNN